MAEALRPVRARGGLIVQPAFDFTNHPPIHLLIIPGGVVTAELAKPWVIDWIARTAAKAQLTASVCTGAFLLAKAGLLHGKTVTTHWEELDDLHVQFPGLAVRGGTRWIDEGTIATSAGISDGIDLSLHLVERLEGEELAVRTARQMDYAWHRAPA